MATLYEFYQVADDYIGMFSQYVYQTFTIGTTGANNAFNVYSVKCKFQNWGGGGGTITAAIKATSAGVPTGSALCSGTILENTISGEQVKEIIMTTNPSLSPSTKYAIQLHITADGVNVMRKHGSATYSGGNEGYGDGASSWTPDSDDIYFEVWGNPAGVTLTPTALAITTLMPTIIHATIHAETIPLNSTMQIISPTFRINQPLGTIQIGTGTIGSHFIATDYPIVEGLIAGTTKQTINPNLEIS